MAWNDLPSRPNVLILITDQQRDARDWPQGWAEQNLPSLEALKQNGMTFTSAFCSACECAPSRASFVTSTYPQTNGMTRTPPNMDLDPSLPNLATVMAAAGYEVTWKGKWHLFETFGGPGNLDAYGFGGWDPPDGGTVLTANDLGGGLASTGGDPAGNGNDQRYVSAADGAVAYLTQWQALPPEGRKPFCLVVSLANPHDVHVYGQGYATVGYPNDFQSLPIDLPVSYADSLANKPRAQLAIRWLLDNVILPLNPAQGLDALGYAKFYAWLNTYVDAQVGQVMDALNGLGLADGTLVVRYSDHGEMGMAHGLREKVYNAYEETIHVPLVFSNPVAFPEPVATTALASLVDLLPTLATVAGGTAPSGIAGVDLTPVLSGAAPSVQDAVVWAYDDFAGVLPLIANKLRALRTPHWTYVVYFSPLYASPEFELYDLENDPLQLNNLLNPLQVSLEQWQALHAQLTALALAKGTLPVEWPAVTSEALLTPKPVSVPITDQTVAQWEPVLWGK